MKQRVWTYTRGNGILWVQVLNAEQVFLYYINRRRDCREPKRIQVCKVPVETARAYWRVHRTGFPGTIDTFPLDEIKSQLWMKPKWPKTNKSVDEYPKANIIPGHQPFFQDAATLGHQYDLPRSFAGVLAAHDEADEDWFAEYESYGWRNHKRKVKLPSAPEDASLPA